MQKEQKNILIIFILVFVTFFLAITMLSQRKVAVKNKRPESPQMNTKLEGMEPVEEEKEKTINVEPDIITSDVDTSEWADYQDEELGFTAKYPTEWYISKPAINTHQDPNFISYVAFHKHKTTEGVLISVYVYKNVNNFDTSVKEITRRFDGQAFREKTYENSQNVIVHNKEGVKIPIMGNFLTVFKQGDYLYEILFASGNEIEKSVYDAFLLNFEITK